MTLPNFNYIAAKSLAEASELAAAQAGRCVLMAGGTDVILLLKENVLKGVESVIDLKNIPGMDGLEFIEGEGLRLQSHTVSLAADQAGLRQKLLDAHASAGLTPPNAKDVLEELGVTPKEAAPVLRLLCEAGELVKIKDGLYYHGPALADILERVRGWFTTHDNLDVGGLKELLGLSRKYLIALLEYMDNERITVRVGDQRRFRGR